MKYLLSVDGGGTKTMFSIKALSGEEKGSFLSGSSNYKSVGIEAMEQSFTEGMEGLRREYGIEISDIAFSVWGISGYDSEEDYQIIMPQILNTGIPQEKVYLCNDGLLAYYAQASGPGVVVISGTGSIVIGISEEEQIYRSGGWGYNFSDIGSGYWMGAEALKRTLLFCDGCQAYAPLYDEIRKYFGAENFHELPTIITGLTDYFEIARVAKLVGRLGEDGEEESCKIMREGAVVLGKMAASIYQKLGIPDDETGHIVFSGGVMKQNIYRKFLVDTIRKYLGMEERVFEENIIFDVQKNEPVYGGLRLAEWLYERKLSKDVEA